MRAAPEGLIDPMVSVISFWNNEKPIAVLSYFATHPQSYYLTGIPNPDFPGIARFFRQLAVPQALHIHFTGAAGNIGAGKYNDGSPENRLVLAERLADGMKRAWESTKRIPIDSKDVKWKNVPVLLPPSKKSIETEKNGQRRSSAPEDWIRYRRNKPLDLTCLSIASVRILHMPGELFVEYQLAAKAERKDLFIAMAAYCDYGPGYIPTAAAHEQGGYEVSVSKVGPEAESILMDAIKKLLKE